MKKSFKGIITMVLIALTAGLICTSCDPDEVDAFADGYRQGYYGTWNW